jgi:poly(hydroxyalkanoate) depolymerase family esterase
MARRTPLAASIQRTLRAMARAARAGVKAAVKTHKLATSPPPRAARPLTRWIDGMAASAGGVRRYRLFKPPGTRRTSGLPLFVLLHGCRQDAAAIARSTRIHALAAREGFIVLCPEQDHFANPQGCWNWFEMRSGRAAVEAASIIAAIGQACSLHGADPRRVVVAGLSAGASMAALLGARYAGQIRAIAMHSGVAPGTAQSAAGALRGMQGHGRLRALPEGGELPALLVIQGDADHVVAARNGRAAAQWWADATQAQPGPTRRLQRGQRRAAQVTEFRVGTRLVATLCEVDGLGHAWSGGAPGQAYSDPTGPDATRLIWAFAMRAFTPRD